MSLRASQCSFCSSHRCNILTARVQSACSPAATLWPISCETRGASQYDTRSQRSVLVTCFEISLISVWAVEGGCWYTCWAVWLPFCVRFVTILIKWKENEKNSVLIVYTVFKLRVVIRIKMKIICVIRVMHMIMKSWFQFHEVNGMRWSLRKHLNALMPFTTDSDVFNNRKYEVSRANISWFILSKTKI